MADLVLTSCSELIPELSETYSVAKYSGAAVGDVVKADGSGKIAAITDPVGGVVIAVGATNITIMRGGFLTGLSGLAANASVYSDGDGTASDTDPGGAEGAKAWLIGMMISTTTMVFNICVFEQGA